VEVGEVLDDQDVGAEEGFVDGERRVVDGTHIDANHCDALVYQIMCDVFRDGWRLGEVFGFVRVL